MGFATGYLLISGVDRHELLHRLNAALGEPIEEPDDRDTPLCLGPTHQGWTIITDPDGGLWNDLAWLRTLSRDGTVLTGYMEEHEMYSQAELITDGRQVWKVISYSSERDAAGNHITVEGAAPPSLPALLAEARRQEQLRPAVDYQFEIPFQLVTEATGDVINGRHPWIDLDEKGAYRELVLNHPA